MASLAAGHYPGRRPRARPLAWPGRGRYPRRPRQDPEMPDAATSLIARLIVVSERDHRYVHLTDQEVGVGGAPEDVIVVDDDMVARRHCAIEEAAQGSRRG